MTTISARPTVARAGRLLRDRRLPVVVTATLFAVMFGYGSYRYSFDAQVGPNLLVNNGYLVIAAVGATFVILAGGIDLSIGSVIGFSGMLFAELVMRAHLPVPLAALVVLVTGCAGGALMGCMIHFFNVQPFIATLTGLFLFRGLSLVLSKAAISVRAPMVDSLAQYHLPLLSDTFLSTGAIVAILVALVAAYVLHLTPFGRRVYAIGGNEQSAMLMGLPVGRTKITLYAISGTCSALAGLVFVLYIQSGDPLHGIGMELDAIAAVVIGGTLLTGGAGYVLGSVLGVLVLGLIKTMISAEGTLSSWWIKIFTGVLVLIFILLQRIIAVRRA
jgi:simple sugar transport system permease protein